MFIAFSIKYTSLWCVELFSHPFYMWNSKPHNWNENPCHRCVSQVKLDLTNNPAFNFNASHFLTEDICEQAWVVSSDTNSPHILRKPVDVYWKREEKNKWCVCMCVRCMCATCTCVSGCEFLCIQTEARGRSFPCSTCFYLFSWDQGSQWPWSQAGVVLSSPSSLHIVGFQGHAPTPTFLHGFWGWELRSSYLLSVLTN